MNLEIIGKRINKNVSNETNTVYFKMDGIKKQVDIVYLTMIISGQVKKFNAFLDNKYIQDLEQYVIDHYDCDINEFKKYFMYKLYKYSRGVNLMFDCIGITDDIINNIEGRTYRD